MSDPQLEYGQPTEPRSIASIVSLFDETAGRCAERIAVRDGRGTYTYGELGELSARISACLRDRGARPGDVVALLFGQSREAIPAIMGVLRAGCWFVPLDVNDPDARLRLILEDCDPVLILTQGRLAPAAGLLQPDTGRVVDLDRITLPAPVPLPDSGPGPDAGASIYYTSGSTGTPKGVCQTHENLVHFARVYAQNLGIGPEDRLSMIFSMSFGASSMDLFPALLNGASLHLYNARDTGLVRMVEWLERERISVLHAVPSVFRQLLKTVRDDFRFQHIRAVDLGGDPLYSGDVRLIRDHFPENCQVFNHYAATEASVICQHRIRTEAPYPEGRLPVGRPAPGIKLSIEREDGTHAGVRETGRVVVHSRYLSTGYWRRSDLSREHFSRDGEGIRTYRGGDLAYVDEHGEVHHMGRSDSRVKVAGHTVDIAEVETALVACEGVDTAVVVAVSDDGAGDTTLAAYVVPGSGADIDEPRIREYMRSRVPRYMAPTRIRFIDRLPETDTGKIDRAGLEVDARGGGRSGSAGDVRDQDGESSRLAGLFSAALGRPDVELDTGFYEQGGDSLRLADLIGRIEREFDVRLSEAFAGKDPTVGQLEEALTRAMRVQRGDAGSPAESLLIPLKLTEGLPNVFIVHGRNGLAFTSPKFVDLLGRHFSVYSIRARGLREGEYPHLSIEGMAAEYVQEIRQVQLNGPYYLMGLCAGSITAIEMAIQLKRVGENVAPVIVVDPAGESESIRDPASRKVRMTQLVTNIQDALSKPRSGVSEKVDMLKKKRKVSVEGDADSIAPHAHRIAVSFKMALTIYRPQDYDGEVLVIGSYIRLSELQKYGDGFLRGNKQYFCVSALHARTIREESQPLFDALERCVTSVAAGKFDGDDGRGASSVGDSPTDLDSALSGFRASRTGRILLKDLWRRNRRKRIARIYQMATRVRTRLKQVVGLGAPR